MLSDQQQYNNPQHQITTSDKGIEYNIQDPYQTKPIYNNLQPSPMITQYIPIMEQPVANIKQLEEYDENHLQLSQTAQPEDNDGMMYDCVQPSEREMSTVIQTAQKDTTTITTTTVGK